MWPVLSKVFIRSFYSANAGFFLFFLFIFFGAVEGGQLLSYHFSLMKSIVSSTTVLLLVLFFWTLYHLKCTAFFLRIIASHEGAFLFYLQTLSPKRQRGIYTGLYAAVYAPVLFYAVVVAVAGWTLGYTIHAAVILLFQVFSVFFFTKIIQYRLNHWLHVFYFPSFCLPFRKQLLLCTFYHFFIERKNALLLLKAFSLSILYIIVVWNKGRYDNDSFMLFYLVLFLAHAALPYYSVQFLELRFPVYRNLPVPLYRRALVFLLSYTIVVIPEMVYLFYFGDALPVANKLAYSINLPASLFLLTAIQYSEAQSREEYLKATFALFFISIFVLHVEAFWWWIMIQLLIAFVLFASGYYQYEREE